MPALSLALVILAGLIHAVWNIAAKKAGGDVRFAAFTGLLMALIWAPLGIWLGWDVVPTWGRVEWGFVAVSGVLHVLYYVTLLRGYRKADLTVVYPLARGSGPLLSSLVAILRARRADHGVRRGGHLRGGRGGVLHRRRTGTVSGRARSGESRPGMREGMFYGLSTGVFIAGYTVIDGYAGQDHGDVSDPARLLRRLRCGCCFSCRRCCATG